MAYQTTHNPGAFSKRRKTRLVSFFKRIVNSLRKADFNDAKNYLISEGINIWNDRITIITLGKSYQCNICGYEGRFVHKANRLGIAWNSICPNCDSRSRHRGLYELYKNSINPNESILHFAPEPILSQLFKDAYHYKTTDYLLEDVDFPSQDIQNLTLPSEMYDWILCNHVIEHVPYDDKAMAEMSRVLRPKGNAIITIPGNYNRNSTVLFNDLSLNGHYRDYGMDVVKKLEQYFSEVKPVDLATVVASDKFSVKKKDYAFICKK